MSDPHFETKLRQQKYPIVVSYVDAWAGGLIKRTIHRDRLADPLVFAVFAALARLGAILPWSAESPLRYEARPSDNSRGTWMVLGGGIDDARAYDLTEAQAHAIAAILNGGES